jgi:hypothetical protein
MMTKADGAKRGTWRGGWPLALLIGVVMTISCSGCLLLAIPSLGYEGYEYEKTGSIPGVPSSTTSPSSENQNNKNNNSSNNGASSGQ